jgi:hypothetical protein
MIVILRLQSFKTFPSNNSAGLGGIAPADSGNSYIRHASLQVLDPDRLTTNN